MAAVALTERVKQNYFPSDKTGGKIKCNTQYSLRYVCSVYCTYP